MKSEKRPDENPEKRITRLIDLIGRVHGAREVFCDFVAAAALSFQQAVHVARWRRQSPEIENTYLSIVKKYGREDFGHFAQMLSATIDGIEKNRDFLGDVYMALEVRRRSSGQFFTPWHVAALMAGIAANDAISFIQKSPDGVFTFSDPACGSGVMALAAAKSLQDRGIAPIRHFRAILTDVDRVCADMAYIQTTLLGIPAIVIHGNSLSLEAYGSRENFPLILQETEIAKKKSGLRKAVNKTATVSAGGQARKRSVSQDIIQGAK